MRSEDVLDYFRLRRLVDNPLEVLGFRKRQTPEDLLRVRLKHQPHVTLRGGCADFHMFHRIFLRDEYRLRPWPGPAWGTVVDLGANVGLFSARVAPHAKRVIACEPMLQNFLQLQRNTAGLDGIVPVQTAVSGEAGTLRLHPPADPGLSGVFSAFRTPGDRRLAKRTVSVPALTLDELCDRHRIASVDLLKIDIEGGEYGVLYAAQKVLPRIRRIAGEYHDLGPDDPGARIEPLADFLRAQGFGRVEVIPHPRWPGHGMFFATSD